MDWRSNTEGVERQRRERSHRARTIQYDEIALQLQDRLDEKEEKAENIRKSFSTFKREIALAAENSRTGRPIRRKSSKFKATEIEKRRYVSKRRLRNINLKMQLKN